MIISLSGCIATKTQTTESNQQQSSQQTVTRSDSVFIYVHDSVFVKVGGDTVFFEKYKNIYRDRWHTDTLIKTDSMIIDNSRTEIIEVNRLKWWQKSLMWIGVVAMAAIIIKIGIKFIKL